MPSIRSRVSLTAGLLAVALAGRAAAGEPLGVEAYVQAVLRSHPGARQISALESAAAAERKAVRVLPDPVVEFAWDRARAAAGGDGDETEWSVSQTLPWPGTFAANVRAGDRQADALRAEGRGARWDLEIEARATFARLLYARSAAEIAKAAEADALALRDLTSKRAELGESREVDRIKTEVEWLRQQRTRRSLEREAAAVEAVLRNLAVEPLPQPLLLAGDLPAPFHELDRQDLRARLLESNPALQAARASAERDAALASVARRGRVPDLEATWFRSRELDQTANGLRLGLRVPLWNAKRGEIARAEAEAAFSAAVAERAALERMAALERALQELDVASTQADMLERRILPAADRSLGLARFSYQEGETSLLELLDAQRTFRETQREAAASRLAVALALAEVQRLVGPDFIPGRS